MKWGLIARSDRGGLGIESRGFLKHLKPDRVLIVNLGDYPKFPGDFPPDAIVCNGIPADADLRRFVAGLDTVFTIETPYNWNLFSICRELGCRSVMKINYEWLLQGAPEPDMYIYPSEWHSGGLVLPFPVDRDEHPFRLRRKADTFLHVIGHNAGFDRNGTDLLFKAMEHIKKRVIVCSQVALEHVPKNVDLRVGDLDYIPYDEADVLLFPRRYGGQSLVLNEALSRGMAVISTNMFPQNAFLPPGLLLPSKISSVTIKREVEYGTFDPIALARLVNDLGDIEAYSRMSDSVAEKMSWKSLLIHYRHALGLDIITPVNKSKQHA